VIVKNDGGLYLTRQGEYTGSNRIVEVADVKCPRSRVSEALSGQGRYEEAKRGVDKYSG
jgi:hypothetical protein